ncbi:hypothetical protein ACIPYQ_19760 [Streptomyces sp. NPDC090045]|uniref:hypothetical protein n=1 Tax=Streptomyces sp. NPDC090045 TaxID=3365927 RepID=UPI003829BF5B
MGDGRLGEAERGGGGGDFTCAASPVPEPAPGAALVENLLPSVDPPPATAGRCPQVGAISTYNGDRSPVAPRNLFEVVHKSLRLEGVLVRNHTNLQEEMEDLLVPHLRSGRIGTDTTVAQGFDRTVEAFLGMLRGDNLGKMLVRIDG